MTIDIAKVIHITQIKDLLKRTNMRTIYEKQIQNHKVEKFSWMLRADFHMYFSAKTLTQANQNTKLQVNSVSYIKNIIEDLQQHLEKNKCQKLQYSCLSTDYQLLLEIAVHKASVPGFIDSLAMFIKQEQTKVKGMENTLDKSREDNN